MPSLGHNSVAGDMLLHVIEEVEKLIEDRSAINENIKAILDSAEGQGLDKKTIREMIRMRALDKEEREQREELRSIYLVALGLE